MNWKTIITAGVTGLAAGLALGALLFHSWEQRQTPQVSGQSPFGQSGSTLEASNLSKQTSPPTAHNNGSSTALPRETTRVSADLASTSGFVKTNQHGPLVVVPADFIASLSRAGRIRNLDQPLFSEESPLADYLQLAPSEVAGLESRWGDLREQIRSLETGSARFEEQPDGSLEVIQPDLKTEIATLVQGFRTSVAQTLGANRSEVLLAAAQIGDVFDALGSGRKMTVRAEQTGDGGWRYHTVVEDRKGKRTYVGESVPSSLEHLTGRLEIAEFEED